MVSGLFTVWVGPPKNKFFGTMSETVLKFADLAALAKAIAQEGGTMPCPILLVSGTKAGR